MIPSPSHPLSFCLSPFFPSSTCLFFYISLCISVQAIAWEYVQETSAQVESCSYVLDMSGMTQRASWQLECRIRVTAVKKEPGYMRAYLWKGEEQGGFGPEWGARPKKSVAGGWTEGSWSLSHGRFSSAVMSGTSERRALQIAWLALAEEDEGAYTGGRQPETDAWTQAAKPHRARRGPNA